MTNIFRTAIGFLILIRVWFLQKALKSKNIYLTKDSDHYIELSGDIFEKVAVCIFLQTIN